MNEKTNFDLTSVLWKVAAITAACLLKRTLSTSHQISALTVETFKDHSL